MSVVAGLIVAVASEPLAWARMTGRGRGRGQYGRWPTPLRTPAWSSIYDIFSTRGTTRRTPQSRAEGPYPPPQGGYGGGRGERLRQAGVPADDLQARSDPASVRAGYVDGSLTVTIEHAPTCPWLNRVAGDAPRVETPFGVRVDCRPFRAGEVP